MDILFELDLVLVNNEIRGPLPMQIGTLIQIIPSITQVTPLSFNTINLTSKFINRLILDLLYKVRRKHFAKP